MRGAADDDAQRKLFVSTLKRWVDDAGVGKVTELDHVDALEPRYNLGGRRALPCPASCGRRCRRAPPRQSPKGWPSPDLRQAARTTPCASLMRPTSPASDQDAYDFLPKDVVFGDNRVPSILSSTSVLLSERTCKQRAITKISKTHLSCLEAREIVHFDGATASRANFSDMWCSGDPDRRS